METTIETTKFKQFKRDAQVSLFNSKTPEQLERILAKALVKINREFPKERPEGIHQSIQRALETGDQAETVQNPGFVSMESDGTPLDQL